MSTPQVPLRSHWGTTGGIRCDNHILGILPSYSLMTGESILVCEKAEGGQHLADTFWDQGHILVMSSIPCVV